MDVVCGGEVEAGKIPRTRKGDAHYFTLTTLRTYFLTISEERRKDHIHLNIIKHFILQTKLYVSLIYMPYHCSKLNEACSWLQMHHEIVIPQTFLSQESDASQLILYCWSLGCLPPTAITSRHELL